MRSAAEWRWVLAEQGSTHDLASFILRDLVGYRKNTKDRDDDLGNLTAALDMLLNHGRALARAEAGTTDTPALNAFLDGFAAIGSQTRTLGSDTETGGWLVESHPTPLQAPRRFIIEVDREGRKRRVVKEITNE